MGRPRSVTRTSSPALTDLRYSLREAFSLDTVVVFMRTPLRLIQLDYYGQLSIPVKTDFRRKVTLDPQGFCSYADEVKRGGAINGSLAIRNAHGVQKTDVRMKPRGRFCQLSQNEASKMQCPRCQHENPVRSEVLRRVRSAARVRMPRLRRVRILPRNKFCGQCGAPLVQACRLPRSSRLPKLTLPSILPKKFSIPKTRLKENESRSRCCSPT